SHRSKDFVGVMDEARGLVRELLGVPDDYEVLFLQGGASTGFLMAAYNLMGAHKKGAYVVTGSWAKKAAKEANFMGTSEVIASSEDRNFCYVPKGYTIPTDADFLHLTSNNTIFGTQLHEFPESPIPVACDMSSDIFSQPVNVADFDLIYAGAQKNMGPAGTTLFIVKKAALERIQHDIPTMLSFQTHAAKDSMFNTPPVFAVYVSMLTLRWLKAQGGVEAIGALNRQKADLLYGEIDANPLFEGTADEADRSRMNATFVLTDETNKAAFDQLWQDARINGLKGHRSVGGYRASMYNALPLASVQVLVDAMREFSQKYG
ncbi:MAG: 3-phosphoserine/phosphohydroxythreonine transaminase, partial [Bacteroidota bacterium]